MRKQIRPAILFRRIARSTLAAIVWTLASASIAHAHGGLAGPAEIGPPIVTSVALAFVCYWLVILWPATKRDANRSQARTDDRARASGAAKSGVAKSRAAKQQAQLRNVAANARFADERVRGGKR
jgi:hypothetical protein